MWESNPTPRTIRLSTLGTSLSGIETTAQALIRRNCQAQLDMLITTFSVGETVASPAG